MEKRQRPPPGEMGAEERSQNMKRVELVQVRFIVYICFIGTDIQVINKNNASTHKNNELEQRNSVAANFNDYIRICVTLTRIF